MGGLPARSYLHQLVAVAWLLLMRQSAANPNAKRLYEDILQQKGYNNVIRPPATNKTETLVVRLGLKLSQLIDVDEKNQILTTNVWIMQQWEDSNLRWDPRQYGGVDHMYVPADKIWLPDIVLFNNADGTYEGSHETKATVNSTGTVEWNPPAVFKSSCDINIEFFPFDEQKCIMIFGSWTYDGQEIDLKHTWDHSRDGDHQVVGKGMDLNDLYPNPEWDLMAVPAQREVNDNGQSYITFQIKIRRRSLFYIINLMIPCIALCFVTCLVFYLPADSRQKMSFCINILLSLTVFFLLLAEIIPPTSLVVPLIGKYLLFTMFMVTASVIVTVVVLNVHYRTRATHELPWWVRKVFLDFLPRVLIMRRPKLLEFVQRSQKIKSMRKKSPSNKWNGIINVGLAEERFPARGSSRFPYSSPSPRRQSYGQYVIENGMNPQITRRRYQNPQSINKPCMVRGHTNCEGCRRGMCFGMENNHIWYTSEAERTMAAVQYIATHLMDEDEDRKVREEWKYIALVIDRLFLWIFGGMSVFGTFAICLRAPSLFDKTPPLNIGQDVTTATSSSHYKRCQQ